MNRITFATMVNPGEEAHRSLMLADSIRGFGGSLAGETIWGLVPDSGARLPLSLVTGFERAGVRLVPYEVDQALRTIPFGDKVAAVARAETMASCERMAWLDPGSLVVSDPDEFLIGDGVALGYRPVHQRLVGSPWDDPIDGYWRIVYEACEVPDGRLFRMATTVGESIRPYLSAGVFVVRPEVGLMARWAETLARVARHREIADHYRRDRRCEEFLHQAVWTGVVLRSLSREEMYQLSPAIDYPLHLHREIRAGRRALTIESLAVVRTGKVLDEPDWREAPLLEPLVPWLESREFMGGR